VLTVVLDTNILVSAARAARDRRYSATAWAVHVALFAEHRYHSVTSEPLLRELQDVLERRALPHPETTKSFVHAVEDVSIVIPIYNVPMGCRDRKDDKVIETAMNANADYIVTHDQDLHAAEARYAIGKVGIGIRDRPIHVVDVRTFLAELGGQRPFSPLVCAELAA
jgi:putative PIN family toxin of toxin-antitoxin system